eukprot:251350_1
MFTPQTIFRRAPHGCIVPFGRRPISGFGFEFVVNLFSGLLDEQIRRFEDAYGDNETEGADRTGAIVFIGKKKKGKSFNASMTSFIATTNPCHFAIGNKDHHNTIGLDISPPLNVYSREPMEKRRLAKLCVIDIEGFELRDDTMKLMKNIINELKCVVVLSCLTQINNEDIELCKALFEDATDDKRPLIVVLAGSIVDDPEKGDNFKKIKQIHDACHFCELPWIENKTNKKVRKAMQEMPYKNPTKFMSRKEFAGYVVVWDTISKELEGSKCKMNQIARVILGRERD